ncbi:MAG: hypothetical protein SPI61_04370 [Ezakiella sp.]|uniref:hypothetical protein n=1 Tax=Ezakiella sp. TaxID=1935205 RepID=UPI002977B53D|nr:hypothetical protein [Ezakiella sp.]MDD7730815.1 hypothetical protein [Eubacteriales bacterium]MDY6079936.1 hypothetical protein [Ezakiella sp.]
MNDLFKKHLRTLKLISVDNHNPSDVEYMTESEYVAIDFDAVKDDYVMRLDTYVNPKSIDALVFHENHATMIEFKNGIVDKALINSIIDKMLNSVIMYADITGETIAHARENVDFILVYNYEKNPFNIKEYRQNKYRDAFVRKLSEKAKERYTQFGLARYEGYIFRHVYTYSKRDFKNEFTDKLEDQ